MLSSTVLGRKSGKKSQRDKMNLNEELSLEQYYIFNVILEKLFIIEAQNAALLRAIILNGDASLLQKYEDILSQIQKEKKQTWLDLREGDL